VAVRKQGKAAVTVCSSAFVSLGRAQAGALKHAQLPIAVVAHPFGALQRAAVTGQAERCVEQIMAVLAGSMPS